MSEACTAEGIAARVREALEAAGVTPERFAEELRRPAGVAAGILAGTRPVSSLAAAVAAELSGEDPGYLITGERGSLRVIGPCVMPDDA